MRAQGRGNAGERVIRRVVKAKGSEEKGVGGDSTSVGAQEGESCGGGKSQGGAAGIVMVIMMSSLLFVVTCGISNETSFVPFQSVSPSTSGRYKGPTIHVLAT
jgi:hypothetical protein